MSGAREAEAEAIIARLGMIEHPEGGWYAETWRGGEELAGRPAASAIYFLLEKGQRSHWHRIDGAEVWLWHAGHTLALGLAEKDAGPVHWLRLGAMCWRARWGRA
jgi:predicted cupin superfamily sugar epimerase